MTKPGKSTSSGAGCNFSKMLLKIGDSPLSSLFQLPHLPSFSLSPPVSLNVKPIECSISHIHSYGTVDYDKKPALKWSSLYRKISTLQNPNVGLGAILDEWDREEKRLSKWFLCRVAKELRKFRRFRLALEVYEWMVAQEDRFTFTSSDMAIQLDLISKVNGIPKAEYYFSTIPEQLRDKRTYGSLLHAYSQEQMKNKAEPLFEKMKTKGLITDVLPYNVMITLYLNLEEHEKVNVIINDLKQQNVNFDLYTYNIWITNCAAMGNLEEMETIVERMISDSRINPNWTTYSTLAAMHMKAGNFEKAEKCLKEVEVRLIGRDRKPFNYLLGYYSSLGKKDDVYRIWNRYKTSFPNILNLGYQAMLCSLLRLDDIHGAEKIFNEWLSKTSSFDPRICNALMGWYTRKGKIHKAKVVFDRLIEKGGKPRPTTWEILAEAYIKERSISDALSCMKNAASHRNVTKWRPKLVNVTNIMVLCKELNEMENVDLLVDVLRQCGCLEDKEYKLLVST